MASNTGDKYVAISMADLVELKRLMDLATDARNGDTTQTWAAYEHLVSMKTYPVQQPE